MLLLLLVVVVGRVARKQKYNPFQTNVASFFQSLQVTVTAVISGL